MKKVVLNSAIFTLIFCLWLTITYFAIKARQTTNPWFPETSPIGSFYVGNWETLTAAKWNALIEKVSNRSTFRAIWSSTSVPTATSKIISFTSEIFDTNDEFDASAGRFTPKRAGKYLLTAQCDFSSITDWREVIVGLYKNWSHVSWWSRSNNGGTSRNNSAISMVLDANVWDYFEIGCYQNSWATKTMGDAYFGGFMVE